MIPLLPNRSASAALLLFGALVCAPAAAQEPAEPAAPAAAEPTAAPEETSAAPAATPRLSRLQGRAYLGRRDWVVGATVTVLRPADESTIHLTSTDGKGEFRIEALPDGQYDVRIERDGLTPVLKREIEVRFPFRAVVEVPMVRESREAREEPAVADRTASGGAVGLSGRVTNPAGEPLAEIGLRLVRPDGSHDPRTARSDPEGGFAFEGLEAGPWRLEVQGAGFLPLWTTVELQRPTRLLLRLVRQPAGYQPTPLELMPRERPIPPAGLRASAAPAA